MPIPTHGFDAPPSSTGSPYPNPIVQEGDPGAVGPGTWWVIPSTGAESIRNAANTGWIATSGSGAIPNIGQVLTAGDDAGAKPITNLTNPTNPQDAATKAYVDAAVPLRAVNPSAVSAASDYVAREKLAGDATYRLVVGLDASDAGSIALGPGGVTAPDTVLARTAPGKLLLYDGNPTHYTTASLTIYGTLNAASGILVSGHSLAPRIGAGVPSGAPSAAELGIAIDTTAVTGGVYGWSGAAWVKAGP